MSNQYCRCQKVLNNIDLLKLLTNPPTGAFDNVLNSVVAFTAVQIGYSDVLKTISIKPDNIIGKKLIHDAMFFS